MTGPKPYCTKAVIPELCIKGSPEEMGEAAAGILAGWAAHIPRFSPDGERISFNARYGGFDPADIRADVFTIDKNGRSLRKLSSGNNIDDGAFWLNR